MSIRKENKGNTSARQQMEKYIQFWMSLQWVLDTDNQGSLHDQELPVNDSWISMIKGYCFHLNG